jgi:hypothetical protein
VLETPGQTRIVRHRGMSSPEREYTDKVRCVKMKAVPEWWNGRHSRLKICWGAIPVWVRVPPSAPPSSVCASCVPTEPISAYRSKSRQKKPSGQLLSDQRFTGLSESAMISTEARGMDLKSVFSQEECGFKSRPGHQIARAGTTGAPARRIAKSCTSMPVGSVASPGVCHR